MAEPYLPHEILLEIFTRLPAKSVGKCRCLAKLWNNLLSTPRFIESHHLTRKLHPENLILLSPTGSVHTAAAVANGAVSRKLRSPERCTEVAGSCDGLILLFDVENRKFIVNPTTLQLIKIHDWPLDLNKGDSFSMYGLGYDRTSDDYKIVALSYWDTDNEHNPDCADTFVDVYSVKGGFWKRVDSSPYDHAVPYLSCGAFVNGALHWLASSRERGYPSVIAAFDLAREVFDEMPAPSDADPEKFVFYRLVVLGGCLCMVGDGSNGINVWMMKEYGVGGSWTKFSIEGEHEFDIVKPLSFVGDEEVVFLTEEESLVVYNVKANSFREMAVDGARASFVDGCPFVESLVELKSDVN